MAAIRAAFALQAGSVGVQLCSEQRRNALRLVAMLGWVERRPWKPHPKGHFHVAALREAARWGSARVFLTAVDNPEGKRRRARVSVQH